MKCKKNGSGRDQQTNDICGSQKRDDHGMGSWEETVTDMSTERDRDARRACVWDITGQAWELEKSDGGGWLLESLMAYFLGKGIGKVPRLGDRRPGGGTG